MKRTLFVIFIALITLFAASLAQAEDPPEFILKWGTAGTGDGQFNCPAGIAADAWGNVYVADYMNDRVQKFTSDGVFIRKWGTYGTGNGQFNYPAGIAADAWGNVYVAEYGNNRVQKFTSDGTFILKWGSYGAGDGQFYAPFGITVDAGNNVYVADYGNNRVQKFTSEGEFITKWGTAGTGDGQFNYPAGIAADAWGNIYVTDYGNYRVQKFTSDGEFILKWGTIGIGDGQFYYPRGITVDAWGNVYVAEYENNRVQKFTSEGVFILKWGTSGGGDGQFRWPADIAADAWGNIYVTDYLNNRVQKFGFLAPHDLVIKDVVNDQGRLVRLNFTKSGRDSYNSLTPILQYEAYRRIDPLLNATVNSAPTKIQGQILHPSPMLMDWEFVGAIPAHGEDGYNMIAPTLADSTKEQGIYWSEFFIRAATADPLVYFDSAVDSGYSVDNLAPAAPLNLSVEADMLTWNPASEPDFNFYSIYGSSSAEFDETAVLIEHTTENSYDLSEATGCTYYFVSVTDFNGNESGVSSPAYLTGVEDLPPLKLALSAYPNPFNPMTTIIYNVPKAGLISLSVYDVNGGLVKTLINHEQRETGQYRFAYQHQGASGVYFLRLSSGAEIKTQKIVVLR
ncbi:MAG: T9SS type A sorting domain-containing protein [Patescibacteria group bacterium]